MNFYFEKEKNIMKKHVRLLALIMALALVLSTACVFAADELPEGWQPADGARTVDPAAQGA